MPIREFECQDCHYQWEKLNPQNEKCPNCGSKKIKQKFSTCNWNWGGLLLYFKEEKLA